VDLIAGVHQLTCAPDVFAQHGADPEAVRQSRLALLVARRLLPRPRQPEERIALGVDFDAPVARERLSRAPRCSDSTSP
jgi:hypothetical protein